MAINVIFFKLYKLFKHFLKVILRNLELKTALSIQDSFMHMTKMYFCVCVEQFCISIVNTFSDDL